MAEPLGPKPLLNALSELPIIASNLFGAWLAYKRNGDAIGAACAGFGCVSLAGLAGLLYFGTADKGLRGVYKASLTLSNCIGMPLIGHTAVLACCARFGAPQALSDAVGNTWIYTAVCAAVTALAIAAKKPDVATNVLNSFGFMLPMLWYVLAHVHDYRAFASMVAIVATASTLGLSTTTMLAGVPRFTWAHVAIGIATCGLAQTTGLK